MSFSYKNLIITLRILKTKKQLINPKTLKNLKIQNQIIKSFSLNRSICFKQNKYSKTLKWDFFHWMNLVNTKKYFFSRLECGKSIYFFFLCFFQWFSLLCFKLVTEKKILDQNKIFVKLKVCDRRRKIKGLKCFLSL
jgi:hypothetical protein